MLKASYPLIRRTRVPNLWSWIIYPENINNSSITLKITHTKEEQNSVYPGQGSQTKSTSIPTQSVRAHVKYFAHRIHSSTLWSSEKRAVQSTQSASCSFSSVESSAKGTVRSVSESDGLSDEVGSRQTTLFRPFEGPRRAFVAKRFVFGFSVLFDFLFLSCPNKISVRWTHYFFTVPPRGFGCRFRLGTQLISDARRASAEVNGEKLAKLNDGWSPVFTKAGWFTGAASVSTEARGKSCGLKMSQG